MPYIDMVIDEAARLYRLSHQEVLRGGYTFVSYLWMKRFKR